MPLVDDIRAVHERRDLNEDDKRRRLYELKAISLMDVIQRGADKLPPMLGRKINHKGFAFQINSASVTPDHRLHLDVTFIKPPAQPVTHQINITNPPVLPRERTGNERQDLIAAVSEMLEGFV